MRLLIFSISLLILVAIFGFFIFNNLEVVKVTIWEDINITAPAGVIVLGSILVGVFLSSLWYVWGTLSSYVKIKLKENTLQQVIDLYRNSIILDQAYLLGETKICEELAKNLKSPVPELDFLVELQKAKIIVDPSDKLKALEALRSQFPSNPYLAYELTVTYLRMGDENAAFEHLKSFNQLVPTAVSLKLGCEIAIKLGQLDIAQDWLRELKALGFTDHQLKQKLLESRVKQLYLEGKDYLAETKQLLKEYPLSLVGHLYMAYYHKPINPSLAAKHLSQRAEIGKDYSYWRDVIDFWRSVGEIEAAIKCAMEFIGKSSSENQRAVAKLDLARLYIHSNRWRDAENTLESLTEEERLSTAVISVDKLSRFYEALIKLKTGSTVDSMRALDTVLVQ